MNLHEWLQPLQLEVTLPSSSPDSVVCIFQGNMGLPGLSGNPGPLGRKVGLGSMLGLDHGLTSKLGLQAEALWATCASWLHLGSLAQSLLARDKRFLSPECAGVGSPLV